MYQYTSYSTCTQPEPLLLMPKYYLNKYYNKKYFEIYVGNTAVKYKQAVILSRVPQRTLYCCMATAVYDTVLFLGFSAFSGVGHKRSCVIHCLATLIHSMMHEDGIFTEIVEFPSTAGCGGIHTEKRVINQRISTPSGRGWLWTRLVCV